MPDDWGEEEEVIGDIPVPEALAAPPAPAPSADEGDYEPEPSPAKPKPKPKPKPPAITEEEEITGKISVPAILKPPPAPSKPKPSAAEPVVSDVKKFVEPEPLPPPEAEFPKPDKKGGQIATIDKIKFYVPGSTMQDLGFRTEKAYLAAQAYDLAYGTHPGKEVPKDTVILTDPRGRPQYRVTQEDIDKKPVLSEWLRKNQYKIPITTYKGTEKLFTPKTHKTLMEDLSKAEPEQQFTILREAGIFPSKAIFTGIDAKGNYTYRLPVKKKAAPAVTGRSILTKLIKEKRAPSGSTLISYDDVSGMVTFKPPVSPKLKKFVDPVTGMLRLDKSVAAGIVNIKDYEGFDVKQSDIKAIQKKVDAKKTLEPYRVSGDRYSIVDALVSDEKKVVKAVRTLYDPKDVMLAEKWIERNWKLQEQYLLGRKAPWSTAIKRWYRSITPWEEEKGGTYFKYIKGAISKIPIPAPVAGVLPVLGAVSVAEPTPVGEIVTALFIGGAVAAAVVVPSLLKDKAPDVTQFKSDYPRKLTTQDVILVNPKTKQVAALGAILPVIVTTKGRTAEEVGLPKSGIIWDPAAIPKSVLQEWQENEAIQRRTVEDLQKTMTIPPTPGKLMETPSMIVTKALSAGEIEKFFPGIDWIEPVVFLGPGQQYPIPKRLLTEASTTLAERTGVMVAAQATLQAAKPILRTITKELPYTLTQFETAVKMAEDALASGRQAKIDAAFKVINKAMAMEKAKVTPQVGEHYARAYQAYLAQRKALLARQAALEAARTQYVAFLNQRLKPVSGKTTGEVAKNLAIYLMAQSLFSTATNTAQAVATKAATQAFTKALAQGKTLTETMAKAEAAAKTAVNASTATITDTAVRTAVRAASQTMAQNAALTAVNTATATRALTAAQAITATATLTGIPPPLLPPPIILPKGASDKEKRKAIKKAGGAIAWRHGELHGKDVWHIGMHPYESEADYITVLGRKPTGATIAKGPGSAYQTITLLRGNPPSRKVTGDLGFFDFFIEPKNGRKVGIGFIPDPKLKTTGDITIGRRALPITERRFPLSRGSKIRITPKTPALRR